MKHVIIGTAGHIDHGKTELIRALTGRDTDRLEEEKRRGITIDLGFTWFDLEDGTRCGIIDVPGHEKFISNMAAGVVGMDLVLMVVAADEGIMPQTIEHLDILELYGVEKAVLVITKCDLVDGEWLQMLDRELAEQLKGTILEDAPCAHVSSVTGEGLEELKTLITDLIRESVEEKDIHTIPRLPVDRVFTMPGFGTVVTGTLLSGCISRGDQLEIYPVGKLCRVRALQVHETACENGLAGQRVALNLPGIRREDLHRGCVLSAPGSMKKTNRIDVSLRVLPHAGRAIRNRERLHLFTGSCRLLCRAMLLDCDELRPGESGLAQLLLEQETVVKKGDRFVVRFYSPVETIGGGVILTSNPEKRKRFSEEAVLELKRIRDGSPADLCEAEVRASKDGPLSLKDLAAATSHSAQELKPYLEDLAGRGILFEIPMRKDSWYWYADNALLAGSEITRALNRFYGEHPYRRGILKAEIHSSLMKHVRQAVYPFCLEILSEKGIIRLDREYVCLPDYTYPRDGTFLAVRKLLTDAFARAGYSLLRFSEIDLCGYPEETAADILDILIREETVVRVGTEGEVYTLKTLMDAAEERVREHFLHEEILTVVQVRDMFGISRKSAKQIIAWLDETHVTKRVGGETERVPYR